MSHAVPTVQSVFNPQLGRSYRANSIRNSPTGARRPADADMRSSASWPCTRERLASIVIFRRILVAVHTRSSTGTFVNGNRVPPDEKRPIRSGDTLRFGNTVMVFFDAATLFDFVSRRFLDRRDTGNE